QLPLEVEPLRTGPLFSDVLARFESRARESDRRLRMTGGEIELQADRTRLEQALGNLVDNALRHGRGDVCMSATHSDGRVEVHVTDEAPGFPDDVVGRAFERFPR